MNWQNNGDVFYFKSDIGEKVAVFSYEDTIVDKRNTVNKKMIDFIKMVYSRNFDIVIISNQGQYPVGKITPIGIPRPQDINHNTFQNTINNFAKILDIPFSFCYTTSAAKHKPNTTMWNVMINKRINPASFYVGGHAGRPNELTNDDIYFANAIGISFKFVELINNNKFVSAFNFQEKRQPKQIVEAIEPVKVALSEKSDVKIQRVENNSVNGIKMVDTKIDINNIIFNKAGAKIIPSGLGGTHIAKIIPSGLGSETYKIIPNDSSTDVNALIAQINQDNIKELAAEDNIKEPAREDNIVLPATEDNIKEPATLDNIITEDEMDKLMMNKLAIEEDEPIAKEIIINDKCRFYPTNKELVVIMAPPTSIRDEIINSLQSYYKLVKNAAEISGDMCMTINDFETTLLKRYLVFNIDKKSLELKKTNKKEVDKYYKDFIAPKEKNNVIIISWNL
jgi:histidinol phosphatase-like enzyme